MNIRIFTILLAVAAPCLSLRAYDGKKVVIEDEFWSPKFALWRTNTVFDVFEKLDRRSHALENFDRVARGEKGGHRGAHFFDGLLYESIRGACDYLAREPSADLEKLIDGAVDRIVAAQRSDGYLHTWVQLGHAERQWGDNGGCALEQHEVYDAGALIEAGVHHYRATGKTKLLKAGVKFANLLCDTMGPPPKRNHIPTHSLAEEALVKLARLGRAEPGLAQKLGVPVRSADYLALVKFWFDGHGRHCGAPEWERHGAHNGGAPKAMALVHEMTKAKHDPAWRPCWGDYQMDRVPLADYRSIEGHAVRAALLGTGLAAYAAETGDATVATLATRFWESMTGRKMYVTGGVGARSDFERFGDDWELPPDAYLETCAAVASAFYSGWMAERTGDGRYMDEFERVIYNALLTAVGTNGCTYTYQNPLNTAKGDRWDWHGCPCCPPMFLKLTGALPGYVYATDAAGFRINLFMGSRTEFDRAGVRVRVAQRTRYPEDGRIAIAVDPERPVSFRLAVRIPGWARGVESWSGLYHADGERTWSLALNGQPLKPALEKGYACVDRVWRKGDVLTVAVDVSPRTIRADSHVAAVRGLHAVACGPVVMAEERGRMIPYWRVANEGPAPHRVWLEDPAVKVSVDASKVKCEISPWLYGTGMEDVNHEIYGGLDAQRLYGESFEEPPPTGIGDRRQTHGVSASWDKAEAFDGADFIRDTDVFHQGRASQSLVPNGGVAAIANAGLRRWGVPCRAGKKMLGYVWTRGKVDKLEVALQDYWGGKTYAVAEIPMQEGTNWCKAAFALTPSAADPHGRFLVRASGAGQVWLDDAYLADEPTNEFGRLGCREDIVAAFRDEGVTFLRWGGSMVNTPEYKLKNMDGSGARRPYTGFWYRESSGGFGPYEFVRMANAMKLPCSVAINAYDTVEDAVRFATEIRKFDTPVFVQIGNEEIVNWAQNPEDSRTMKGVSNYCAAVRRLVPAMRAANPKLRYIQSAMVMGNDATNLLKTVFHALDGVVDYWDVHVSVVEPGQVRRDTCNADLALKWLKEWNPKTTMKMMILEENGDNHGLDRALAHAVMLEKARAMGPDMLTSCPANALQPYLHNDNWWDQGAIFFTPTEVWLSPCGQAQKLAATHHRELLVEGMTDDPEVSVSATRSRDGKSVVLHLVNTARQPRPVVLNVAGVGRFVVQKVLSLSGATPKADNSPADPQKVVPKDVTAEFHRAPSLRPYSYTVVVIGR